MTKAGPIAAVAVLALFAVAPLLLPLAGAQQPSERAKQIGGQVMCMCGCNQGLTQCNHVGCTRSAGMLQELDQWVARGGSETAITPMFVHEFRTQVYAEPTTAS